MATIAEVNLNENGINGVSTPPEVGEEVDSEDEGRAHTNTSISRIKQNSQTAGDITMEDIKQKIDFSTDEIDTHEIHDDSASPSRSQSEEPPVKLKSSASPSLNTSIMEDEEVEEIAPEQLVAASTSVHEEKTTVESILDRLKAVRSYTADAKALYEQLQINEHSPGNAEQMERVAVLISQLKQQELSYLQVLLKLMESQNVNDGQLNQLESMINRTSEDYNDNDGDTSGEEQDDEEEEIEGAGSNDSMSLRAEISQNNNTTYNDEDDDDGDEEVGNDSVSNELAEQKREIEALHEQRALLLRLQEQQSQLQVLQMRQAKLLQLKKEAEERLSEAEKQFDELGDVTTDMSHDYSLDTDGLLATEEDSQDDPIAERERILMEELAELKVKKKQAEKLMGDASPSQGTDGVNIITREEKKMNESCEELVDPGLLELRHRMKQVEEARMKMRELQEMVQLLQGMTVNEQSKSEKEEVAVAKPRPQVESNERAKSPPTQDEPTIETQDDEVIHLLADYERNIGSRQRELETIRKRKEELKRVEGMLHDLQLMSAAARATRDRDNRSGQGEDDRDDDGCHDEEDSLVEEEAVSHRLASELTKQQELYRDLQRKTQQLKQLQQEIEKLSKGSDPDSALADTTIATWGGSSVTSALSTALEEEVKETEGDDPNLPQYQVDRHTPRHPRPLRRAYSPHDELNSTTGKKIKLEPQTSSGGLDTPKAKKNGSFQHQPNQTQSVTKRSAVWPSVIFSQASGKAGTAPGKVQTPPSFSCPKVTPPATAATLQGGGNVATDYTSLLQQQLANSSAMCFQLMEHQSSLIQALNQKLDTLPHIHEQMIQLHEYHDHLQGYHEYLNSAYWQIMDYSNTEGPQEEMSDTKKKEQQQEAKGRNKENHQTTFSNSPGRQRPPQDSFTEESFNVSLFPPPQFPGPSTAPAVNSPFQRPINPHLQQASPNLKRSRPLGYPHPLFGNQSGSLDVTQEGNVAKQNQETQCEDLTSEGIKDALINTLEVESTSSLPDRGLPTTASMSGGTVFDKLRDTIYSEVATLIASNEDRPHFLVELFRELQLLNTDYLRQRALYSIQDLVTRFLKLENGLDPEDQESDNDGDNPPLSSGVMAGTIATGFSAPIAKRGNSQRFDYTEAVDSASSVSTPPIPEEPFASDILGDTVVKTNKMEPAGEFELDTEELDEEVKAVMTNVIPLLKTRLSEKCDDDLLTVIKSAVIDQVISQTSLKIEGDLGVVFTEQLHTSLTTVIEKYQGRVLKDCGEDLLVDISEVLFNEVAFYRLLKDTHGMSGKDYYRSMTSNSQTTTDIDSVTNSPQRPLVSSLALQTLGTIISKTLQEESESLGNSRDDDLAQAWEKPTDEDQKVTEKTASDKEEHMIDQQDVDTKTKGADDSNGPPQPASVKEDTDDIIENGYVNVVTNNGGTVITPSTNQSASTMEGNMKDQQQPVDPPV